MKMLLIDTIDDHRRYAPVLDYIRSRPNLLQKLLNNRGHCETSDTQISVHIRTPTHVSAIRLSTKTMNASAVNDPSLAELRIRCYKPPDDFSSAAVFERPRMRKAFR